MRILFVCHRFPFPPKRGGKIRPFNTISHLSRNAEVVVASLVRSDEEAREGEGLSAHCERYLMGRVSAAPSMLRMLTRLPTRVPSSMGYFYSPALARQVREVLAREQFDLVWVHCSSVAQYVADYRGAPKVLDFGDMDSQKWLEYARYKPAPLSLGYRLEGSKLEREEKRLAALFDMSTCTTRGELATLDGYGAAKNTGWYPNGVDSEYFSPASEPYEPGHVCFIGRMDYYPNQQCMFDFCANVLPLLQRARRDLRLTIVGANPSRQVRDLASLPGVTVTGSVPDVRPFVRAAAVTVAPLGIARGTQNKILESLAMGVPVVSSRKAALGIDAEPGEHLLVGDDPQEYSEAIMRLVDDPGAREQYARAGRERMLSHHSWAGSMRRVDAIVARVLGAGRAPERAKDFVESTS